MPNLLTTGALFSGFYGIVAAIDKHFAAAGIAVFVAAIFDTLDGRAARATRTESAFGKEYDSLSDMVSFGLAPAIISYQWGVVRIAEYGRAWGRIGWLAIADTVEETLGLHEATQFTRVEDVLQADDAARRAASAVVAERATAQVDPLPSWNDGPAKQAILKFVHATTDAASPEFVPPAERIATFDQDGTLWVEHPIYT